MDRNLTEAKRIDALLEREQKRFEKYGCVRRDLRYGSVHHLPLTDRIRWLRTEKQFGSIAPIIKILGLRDVYTARHSERTSLITYRICMLISMSRFYRNTISLAAYTHDIGKIGISDGTLQKDGRLTDEEYAEIKRHSEYGFELLKNQSKYTHISDGAYYHHERWDGKGYPTGAKGEEIPFPARVIAIADSTDAMMSDRPYRKALSKAECKEELRNNSGTMYEPQLVELVLDNWDYIVDGIYD